MRYSRARQIFISSVGSLLIAASMIGFASTHAVRAATQCSASDFSITTDKDSYQVNEAGNWQLYITTNGMCDKSAVKFELYAYNNTDPAKGLVGSITGCGDKCEFINNTYHWNFNPALAVPGSKTLEVRFFEGNEPLQKNTLAKKITIIAPDGSSAASMAASLQSENSKPPTPVDAVLQVQFGNLTKTSNIALYLATLFNYALTLVGTIAITMVIWGGIKYLTAGADSGKANKAKETITNAVSGLIFAFASYLILSTVNPALVNFKALDIKTVDRILLAQDNWCEDILEHKKLYNISKPEGGKCGETAKVTGQDPSTKVLNDTCTFKRCDNPDDVCSKNGKTYSCNSCLDWTDEKLVEAGAGSPTSFNNSTCLSRGLYQRVEKSHEILCVYTNDTAIATPGCAKLSVSCKNIRTCEDYTSKGVLTVKNAVLPNNYEPSFMRKCTMGVSGGSGKTTTGGAVVGAVGGGKIGGPVGVILGGLAGGGAAYFACALPQPAGYVGIFCSSDPCKVGGDKGCQAYSNLSKHGSIDQMTGVSIADLRYEYCCDKGFDCGDSFNPKPPKDAEDKIGSGPIKPKD